MTETLYVIARLAGTRVALRSRDVDSVVIVKDVTPVPHAPGHVAGLFALRSRVMTLIDARIVVGGSAERAAESKAIIVDVAGYPYGIVADAVEDACFIENDELPLRGRLDRGWRAVADAMIDHDGDTLLVIDPVRLVNPPLSQAA